MKFTSLRFKKAIRAALFFLLLGAIGMMKGYAYDFSAVCETGQTLYYNITDATNHYVSLTYPGGYSWDGWSGFAKPTGDIILPSAVDYDGVIYTVTSIGYFAFTYCNGLTGDLTIPNSVASIGYSAFYGCSGLTSITIPNSVTSIDDYTFCYCSGLTGDLIIPNCVTSIGESAFYYCSGLTSVTIPNSVTSIGYSAFDGCSGLTGDLIIPNSVTLIGSHAFDGCWALTSVTIGNSVTSIGNSAFFNCGGLTSVTLGNSVTSIGSSAFYGCIGLTSITIPNSVTSIGSSSFYNCSGLTSVTIGNSVTSIGEAAFRNSGLTSVTIPNSVTSIGYSAFEGCSGLTSVTIPNSVTSIGDYTFFQCIGLTSVTIPNSVTSIGDYAFTECYSLTSVTIGNSVTSIGSYSFGLCIGLTSMTILADNPPTLVESYVFEDLNKSIPVFVPCGSLEAYQNAEGWSEFTNIQEDCTQTQTTALSRGWNWYSTYIEQEGIDGLGQLENSIGVPKAIIQSQGDGYVKSILRNGNVLWGGALSSINNEEMYKIGTKYIRTATIEGQVTDPSSHPITINKGWNWIGFPCSQSVSVNEALSGFTPKNGDLIKGIHSYATYNNGTWTGTLNTLEPGQGYMYGSKDRRPKTLVYQSSRGEATQANITPANNYYQPSDDYADNMTLVAVVELDGNELRSEDYELAAFVGDECRGSVKLMYVAPIDRYIAFLTVFGELEEELSFRLTDGFASSLSADRLTYVVDNIAGTLDEPVALRFGATYVNENALANVSVYPNPSEGLFNIEGNGIRRIEVVNVYGQVILSKEVGDYSAQIDLSDNAAGIYLLRVVTDGGITTSQIIKR